MKQVPFTPRRWTRSEYDRLVHLGALHDELVELVGGHLVVAEPQGSYHASALGAAGDVLRAVLPHGWLVRIQMPVALDDESEPEPDLAVVPGEWADYRMSHPSHPILVMEVAESSLSFDREDKGSVYARAGIRDYWIVNLVDRMLEVYRNPGTDPMALYGSRYRLVQRLGPEETVSPLALATVRLAVGDLLP